MNLTHADGKPEDTLKVAVKYQNSYKDVTKLFSKQNGTKMFYRISIVICDILNEKVINMALFDSSSSNWKVDQVGVKRADQPVDTQHVSIKKAKR